MNLNNRNSVGIFFIVLGILFLLLNLPALLPVQTETQKQTNVSTNNKNSETATIWTIFTNNYLIALTTFMPFVGWAFIGAVMWHTGIIVASYNMPYWTLTNMFVWIELSVYSFVILQSAKIVELFLKRKSLKVWIPILKTILITVSIVAVLLWVSAVLEIIVIRHYRL